jgi:phage portal protein BeeE
MLGRFLKLFERKSDAYEALLGIGMATAANIAVTPELALKCVPIYRGVSVRCEVLGSLPFMLYRRRDDDGKDRATDHPLYRLIHHRPNAWTSAAQFVMQLEQDCITDGGGYALANRSGDKIVELIRLAPRSVCVDIDDATLEPKYEVTLKNGTKRPYRWQDILHVPTLGDLAPIKQAREAIGLCMAMERHAGALFGNGARPAGVLKFKRKLADDVYERLRKSWSSGHSGENAGTSEQQLIADAAVLLVLAAPPDQQVEVLKAILGKYIDSLIDGFPGITADEVRKNAANYHQAIKNRIAELAMGECAGSA